MGCPGVGWLDSAPASQDYLLPPPVQAGHTRGLLSSGPQGPASVLLETGRTAAKPGSDVRTRRPLGRAAVCCVHKLSSQHQEGRGGPAVHANCIPAFRGVTTTSETTRQAGVRVRTLPSRSHQCPKGRETAGRPGKTLCSETGPGAMGSVTLTSRKALSLPPLGHPIPSDSVEHSGCSGATRWSAWPSPYSPPRRLQGCSLGPSPRAGSPREDSQSPPAVPLGQAGVSQKWGPRRSESSCPWGHRGCLFVAASAGGSVRELTSCRMDAAHGSWAGHTAGSCPSLARRGRAGGVRPGWWSCVWPTARGSAVSRAPQPAGWLQENLGPRPQVCAGPAAKTPWRGSWSGRPLMASGHPAPGGAPAGAGPVVPVGASGHH